MNVLSRAVQQSLAAFACALFLLPAAGLLVPIASVSAAPASPISMDVHLLVGGRFDASGWAALSISLANDAEPVSGYITASGTDGAVRRSVELPAGARKQLSLYLRPQPFARQVTVDLITTDGRKLATAKAPIEVLAASTADVAIVGDGGGNLAPQLVARGTAGLPNPIALVSADIPERPEPLSGIEAIVWAADSTTLNDAQRRSMERWVASGGQLIVLGGPDWQARTAAFTALLPVASLSASDGAPLADLAHWAGGTPPAGATTLTAASGALRQGGMGLDADDRPLLSVAPSGAGRIIYVAVDLATPAFRGWDGAAAFWTRLLPDDRISAQFGGAVKGDDLVAGQMVQALSYIPSLEVPPAELLLLLIVGYILLIGPVSYVFLRRMDRRELAWVTAPALVIAFSFGSYGIGSVMKGGDILVNAVSVARTTSGGSAASLTTYAGIFSPSRETYDLTVEADALVSSLNTSAFFDGNRPATQQVNLVTEQGDPAHLRGLSVGVFGLQAVSAQAVVPYRPALAVEWRFTDMGIAGTVTNESSEPISDVAVLQQGSGKLIGDLAPGKSIDFTLSIAQFSGQAASEQIYGFSNFGGAQMSERDRQVNTRRSVLDMLAGNGGNMPVELARGLAAEPLVVGWRPAVSGEATGEAAPLDVTVDGHKERTYRETIEVISGRPALGPGKVRLGAGLMPTTVLSTTGDVQRQDFGGIIVGNGEVHFGLALPLEASGLAPSRIRVQVATDPMSILVEQPNMPGQAPPGYRIAIRQAGTDDWIDLGDLNTSSSFEVPDPTLVLGDGGSMEVRVSGTGIDASQGGFPIYVGATVEGSV
jgi:hypothetical protein